MNKSPTVFLLFLCILINILFVPRIILAYAPTPTHANLTDIAIDFYNRNTIINKISSEEKSWIIKGSIDEDTSTRCLNHFYDPIYNKTWQFGGLEYLYPALTAKDWAQSPLAQALYDPFYMASLGPIAKSPVFSSANFTWQRAIYEYAKGNKKMAFESLGHILHLIQDMSVPEHTRENVHIFFIESANSPYELYAAKSNKDFYEQTRKGVQDLKFINKTTLNEYFDEIALYSNNYFLSPDTIPPSKYRLPAIDFPDTPEIQDGVIKHYLIGHDENGELFHLALIVPNIQWRLSGPTLYSLDDKIVLDDYWERLSKKSVINSAGVINLLFQEVEKAKQNPNFIKENENNLFLAAIQGINTFINNIFQKNNDYVVLDNSLLQSTTTIQPLLSTTIPKITTTTFKTTTTTLKSTKSTTTTTLKPTTSTTLKATTTTLKQTTTTTLKTTTTTTIKTNLCSFSTSQFPLRNKIIINEVAWIGTSNSSNDEWIELKNVSSGIIDLSNWQLLDQGEQIKIIFPSTARLGAGQFLLLERTNEETVPNISADIIYVGSLVNQNEGLRLFDNSCQLRDEVFAQPDWPAGDNTSKRTMERKLDLTWQTSALINGTPKQENSNGYVVVNSGGSSNVSNTTTTVTTPTTTQTTTTTTTTTTKPNYAKILITEIKVAGLSSDGKTNVYNEFIELYNPNNFEVNLTGWYLQKKTSQSNEFSSLVPSDLFEGKIINSSGYFLISHSSSTYQGIADILDSNYSVTDNNTIVLKNPNREIVDKVGFGEANDCEGNCAINPDPGKSIHRKYLNDNFIDSDNNFNDFEIQNCSSPKSLEAECQNLLPTTTTTLLPSPLIPYITEFSWHPFDKNSSKIVIDFRTNSYPFIPSTNHTNNIFTAMAFYLHSDSDDPSVNFGIPTDYLGDKYNWELSGNIPGLVLSYPTYVSGTRKVGSIIFTADGNMAANSAAPRKLSYKIDKLPSDNHFIVDITGTTNGQGLNFTPDQYVTIGYYGYANSPSSYLKLIAYDNTKFYFNSSNYYHQPTNVSNFEAKCSEDNCNNLIFSWTPSSDQDIQDILKYDIHYVFAEQGDDLSNNDLTRQSWEWSSPYNVLGESTFYVQDNKFYLQVSLNDLYYLKEKRLPGVPLDVFFGIKAQDSEGLKSEIPKLVFLNIPPIIPETTTTTVEP